MFTEKIVEFPEGFKTPLVPVTVKRLHARTEFEMKACYDPPIITPPEPQKITMIFGDPIFIMSPGIKIYRADQIKDFYGYLSKFEPIDMNIEGESEAIMKVTVIEELN